MNQDNNYMDKKLQQLENQALPDLSKMDEHWQQMRDLMQPAAGTTIKPSNGISKKFYRWMVAAVVLGLIGFFTYKWGVDSPKEEVLTEKGNHLRQGSGDQTQGTQLRQGFGGQAIDKAQGTRHKVQVVSDSAQDLRNVTQYDQGKKTETDRYTSSRKPLTIKPAVGNTPKTSAPSVDLLENDINLKPESKSIPPSSTTLAAFFDAIEKEEQQFVIDNRSDTIITGKDGTALLIPAKAFNLNEPVTITLKEYYSYGDIITNKLNTAAGHQLLETGGMVHVMATVKGQEVNIQPGKSIRWFVPDTSAAMKQMQLFTGEVMPGKRPTVFPAIDGGTTDSISPFIQNNSINWVAQNVNFSNAFLYRSVKVLDLRNEPKRVVSTKKGVKAVFHISILSKMGKKELAALLKEKYDYYKVKIRPQKTKRHGRISLSAGRERYTVTDGLGDSTWMDIAMARRYNLQATDTIVSRTAGAGRFEFYPVREGTNWGMQGVSTRIGSNTKVNPLINNKVLNSLADRYSVDIRTLGWINCDRFYENNNPRIDFYVDLEDTATNYYTFLVFKSIRSVLTGFTSGNRVMFQNVPKGLSATLISVGIKNGKPVSAMKDVVLSTDPVNGLLFEPITPDEFKQEMAALR